MESLIESPILSSKRLAIFSKYLSLNSSLSPERPAAMGIKKKRFSHPGGADVSSVTEVTLT